MTDTATHLNYIQTALQLAKKGLYTTDPNPRVGCVLVKDGQIVGSGWHQFAGKPHAEIHALQEAGENARGATAYVTLEPCSHTGKTGPCADALIQAGITTVVAAMTDPNPVVAGRGFDKLRHAGVEVITDLNPDEAQKLNPGFVKRMTTGLPLLRCKMAMSLDARTAMQSGESQWITGPAARRDVQFLRARSSAIITGIGTLLADNPSLTVRPKAFDIPPEILTDKYQPLPVILDSDLRTPLSAKLLSHPRKPLIVTTLSPVELAKRCESEEGQLIAERANVISLPGYNGRIDLAALLRYLATLQCNEVLLESGEQLAGAFLQENLLDELVIYMAPILMGSEAKPLFQLPLDQMAEKKHLEIIAIDPIDKDWRILARPAN